MTADELRTHLINTELPLGAIAGFTGIHPSQLSLFKKGANLKSDQMGELAKALIELPNLSFQQVRVYVTQGYSKKKS